MVLTNMLHISGEEVVKFLQDTLDCLFDILNTSQETFGEKIFEVLVRWVCGRDGNVIRNMPGLEGGGGGGTGKDGVP